MEYALSELFTLQMGKTPSRDNSSYWKKSENNWVSIADLTNSGKYISNTKETLSDSAVAESGIKKIPANTVIMSFKLSLGKVAITEKEMYSNEAIMAFIDKGVKKISPEYLYYLLRAKDWSKGTNKAVMGATLNKATLSTIKIQLHEYDNQLEIVNMLNRVSSSIDFRKQQLTKLDELVKARFVELTENVNTVPTRMGDIATYINGYAFKPTDWKESGLPIIRIQNLNDATARYNYFDGKIDSKYLVTTGDILVSWATHLEAYIWNGNRAWLNQHIFKVLFNKIPINKIYFVYATEDALRQAFKNAHGFKPTMEHIKRSDFENAIVKLPPMEIQNQFADFVAEVDKSKLLAELFAQNACILAENRSK